MAFPACLRKKESKMFWSMMSGVPMGIKEKIRPEAVLSLRFIAEVKKELESAGATR